MTRHSNNTLDFSKKKNEGGMKTTGIEGFQDAFCEVCGNPFFDQKTIIKRRSALLSPTGKEEVQPVMVLLCDQCGWVFGSPVSEEMRQEVRKAKEQQKAIEMMMSAGRQKKEEKKKSEETKEENKDTVEMGSPENITPEVILEENQPETQENVISE